MSAGFGVQATINPPHRLHEHVEVGWDPPIYTIFHVVTTYTRNHRLRADNNPSLIENNLPVDNVYFGVIRDCGHSACLALDSVPPVNESAKLSSALSLWVLSNTFVDIFNQEPSAFVFEFE